MSDKKKIRNPRFTIVNSWIFNIGNAFIDYGCIASIKKGKLSYEIQLAGFYPFLVFHRVFKSRVSVLFSCWIISS